MLTGIWNNGQMVSNPNTAPEGSVEVHQTRTGGFEVRCLEEALSTFKDIDEANTVAINVSRGLGSDLLGEAL